MFGLLPVVLIQDWSRGTCVEEHGVEALEGYLVIADFELQHAVDLIRRTSRKPKNKWIHYSLIFEIMMSDHANSTQMILSRSC